MKISLRMIAHARSGDKGSNSNVGLLFYSSEIYKWAKTYITTELVKDHFKEVIQETSGDFSILFHDDDFYAPEYLETMLECILNEPEAAAVGCNAYLLYNKKKFFKNSSHYNKQKITFNEKKLFLKNYLVGSKGAAPFPSYIYRTKYIKKINFDKLDAGKHVDVMFLSELISYGKIIWLPNKLMHYRVHNKSDSANENINDRLTLLRYMFRNGISKNSKNVILFKYLSWLNFVKQNKFENYNFNHDNRKKIILKYLFRRTIINFFDLYCWYLLFLKRKFSLILKVMTFRL